MSTSTPSTQQSSPTGDLGLSNSSLSFGSVVVGNSNTLTVTATNSGTASVTISSAKPSAPEFSLSAPSLPVTVAAGKSVTLSVAFTPSAAGNATGTIPISSTASNAVVAVSLSGTGLAPGQLVASPSSVSFGAVLLGSTQTKSAALTNSGGSTVTISQATVSGGNFQVSGLSLPLTLNPGQSTDVAVTFDPQSSGAQTGSITLTTSASMSAPQVRFLVTGFHSSTFSSSHRMSASNNTVTISLSGSGTTPGQLSVAPTTVSFVNVEVGTNQSQSVTLTNSGGSSVSVTQALASGSGFSVSGLTLPLTLTAGQSASFNVLFTPQAAGTVSGNVAFTSNASSSTLNLPLSGAALAPGSLTVSPTSVAFGSVQVGSSQQQSASLTNTGGTSVTISNATATGTDFSLSGLALPVTLAAGQSTTMTVTFAPLSAASFSGSVTITSNAPNPTLVVPLSGTGITPGQLSANPTSLSFASIQVGSSEKLSETLTNSGGSSVTISQDTVTGSGFSVSGFTPPLTLTAGQSYTFSVIFAPQSAGSATGSISIASNASDSTLVIPLSGTATAAGQLAVTPTPLNFSNVVVGTSANLPGSLNASGSSVTVTSANSSNAEFTLSGISLPVTIQAGNSASFTVTFTPQATGAATGTLTFSSNASNTPAVQSLTGTGTAPPVHSVALSWTASTSSNIASYNVYRSTTSGSSYSQIGSVTAPTTTYTDNSVTDGTTYYYVTTAVNSDNQESAYSNQATAAIPPP
ncbi:MAG TPA: choice-of-anchor D domain-containing protein [Terriglobales bacterium]|nr:choice-of-anchor D domain-containing protein [Terriglobales bacterium]